MRETRPLTSVQLSGLAVRVNRQVIQDGVDAHLASQTKGGRGNF